MFLIGGEEPLRRFGVRNGHNAIPLKLSTLPTNFKCSQYVIVYHYWEHLILLGGTGVILGGGYELEAMTGGHAMGRWLSQKARFKGRISFFFGK